jgi:hypothetical protein
MTTRILVCACFALIASTAFASPDSSDEMAERYSDVQHCIERTLGKQWNERFGVEMTVNRWGAVEVTGASIDTAPEIVRVTDLRCRRQLDLAGQPRP